MIKLHEDSKKYIIDTFEMYVEEKMPRELEIERPIIHMYPYEDTRNEYGELNGYNDSLFCELHIFDPNTRKKYVTRNHDAVNVFQANVYDIKVFKDGSTMITAYGKHIIRNTPSLDVESLEKKRVLR